MTINDHLTLLQVEVLDMEILTPQRQQPYLCFNNYLFFVKLSTWRTP